MGVGLRVAWYRSLRFKLLILLVCNLTATVAFISFRDASALRSILDKQFQDSVTSAARRSAIAIEGYADLWKTLVASLMHAATGQSADELDRRARAMLLSNREIIAIDVYRSSAGGPSQLVTRAESIADDDPRIQGKKPADIFASVRKSCENALNKIAAVKGKDRVYIFGVGVDIFPPPLQFVMSYENKTENVRYTSIATVWPDKVLSSLESGRGIRSYLLGDFDSLIVGTERGKLPYHLAAFVQETKNNRLSQAFKAFQEKDRKPSMTAVASLPSLSSRVIMEKDSGDSRELLNWRIRNAALSAWVFLLVAILVAVYAMNTTTKGLLQSVASALKIAQGDLSTRVAVRSRDEVGLLGAAVNHMASEIVGLLETRASIAATAAVREKELLHAQAVQMILFPSKPFVSNRSFIGGVYRPASECAGDWWSYFSLNEHETLLIVVDVTGHGAGSALIGAMASGFLVDYAAGVVKGTRAKLPVSEVMTELNSMLWNAGGGTFTMTGVLIALNSNTRTAEFTLAGHHPPIIVRPPGSNSQSPSSSKLKSVKPGGCILGANQDAVFARQTIELEPFDKIFVFTDGLIECEGSIGKALSKRLLRLWLSDAESLAADDFLAVITERVNQHFGEVALTDDVTMVVAGLFSVVPEVASLATETQPIPVGDG